MAVVSKVHVFVNRSKVDLETTVVTGRQLLSAAGFLPEQWDLFRVRGEGDPTGGTRVELDESIEVKNGEHFRAIPTDRNYGLV
jgi:hypothetical protein